MKYECVLPGTECLITRLVHSAYDAMYRIQCEGKYSFTTLRHFS